MNASRAALVIKTGKDPRGMEAAHGPCHNRLCCNPHPEHGLRWATRQENVDDKKRDGTHKEVEDSVNAKLTRSDVIEIRNDHRAYAEIANDYGISIGAIKCVKNFTNWKHV